VGEQDPAVTGTKHRTATLAELDRLRALRAALVREDVRLRAEAGTVMSLDFIEGLIEESRR
jgi:hypothetical protein